MAWGIIMTAIWALGMVVIAIMSFSMEEGRRSITSSETAAEPTSEAPAHTHKEAA